MKIQRPPVIVAVSVLLSVAATLAAQEAREPFTYLKNHIGFSDQDLLKVGQRRIVTKVLKTVEKDEAAVFGILRLTVPQDVFFETARTIGAYEHDAISKIKAIHVPPQIGDFAGVGFTRGEVDALRKCVPGDCALKVSAAAMERVKAEIDWEAEDHASQVDELLRQMAYEYVFNYLRDGNEALARAEDRSRTVATADALAAVLRDSPYLLEYVPELFTYLEQYPRGKPPGIEEMFYWARESMGRKPYLSLRHVLLYDRPGEEDNAMVISKMIYASRYFRAGMSMTALVKERGPGAGSNKYVMYLERLKADGLHGLFGGLKRDQIEGELVGRVESVLTTLRKQLRAAAAEGR
jgi:hypothetical protein